MTKYDVPENFRELLQLVTEEDMVEASEVYLLGTHHGHDYTSATLAIVDYAEALQKKYEALWQRVKETGAEVIEEGRNGEEQKYH